MSSKVEKYDHELNVVINRELSKRVRFVPSFTRLLVTTTPNYRLLLSTTHQFPSVLLLGFFFSILWFWMQTQMIVFVDFLNVTGHYTQCSRT